MFLNSESMRSVITEKKRFITARGREAVKNARFNKFLLFKLYKYKIVL